MSGDVGPLGVAAALVLVAVAIAVSWRHRLGLVQPLVLSTVRAAGQLIAVGSVLVFVLAADGPLWPSWLWLLAMIVFAAATVARRVTQAGGVFGIALVAFTTTTAVALGVLFGFAIFPLEPRTVVPLAGMAIGNSMTAAVVAGRQLLERFGDQRGSVEAALALGMTPAQAVHPLARGALRTALTPAIETNKSVGLVFLPGAMTGLILAGVDPVDAVLVQVAVMYLVLGAVATSATVIVVLLRGRLFTADWRPRVLGENRSDRADSG